MTKMTKTSPPEILEEYRRALPQILTGLLAIVIISIVIGVGHANEDTILTEENLSELTVEEIEERIIFVQNKIKKQEENEDSLSEKEWFELSALYKQLVSLENQKQQFGKQKLNELKRKQEKNKIAIENYDKAIENIGNIKITIEDN